MKKQQYLLKECIEYKANHLLSFVVSGHHNPYHERRRQEEEGITDSHSIWKSMKKKYVLLCCLCGGLCLALGILYMVIYFVLGRYTTSLHYFQTLPLYIPAIVVSFNFTSSKMQGNNCFSESLCHDQRHQAVESILCLQNDKDRSQNTN